MNYKQKKVFIKIYCDQVKEAAGNEKKLYSLYKEAQNDYHDILDTNLRRLKVKIKIDKVLTAYIIEKYQIVSDCYIYGILPKTVKRAA